MNGRDIRAINLWSRLSPHRMRNSRLAGKQENAMVSNALALVGGDLSTLRRLSLGEIENAFYERVPICGFYILQMGINASVLKEVGLHNITLVHISSGVEIYLNRNGQMEIK